MQKYKTFRAMAHKMRLRVKYYYHFKGHGVNMLGPHAARTYYRAEKEWCKDIRRSCQSAFFTYNVKTPWWMDGKTFWEYFYGGSVADD